MIRLSNSIFQWSTTEQVYPLEKHTDGSTLYCKIIDYGYDTPGKGVSIGVPGFIGNKMWSLEGYKFEDAAPYGPGAWPVNGRRMQAYIEYPGLLVRMITENPVTTEYIILRFIYKK